jgi:hypothetical protein
MFNGSQSRQGKSQSPVTWVASVEETKRMKPTDKAIVRVVSESPGHNASEPSGGPEKKLGPEAELPGPGRRQYGTTQSDRRVVTLRRGG